MQLSNQLMRCAKGFELVEILEMDGYIAQAEADLWIFYYTKNAPGASKDLMRFY